MRDSDSSCPQPTVLSEELAHRLLARAIELDLESRSGTTVEQLRDVARELGIADAAFESALSDVRRPVPAKPPGVVRRCLDHLRGTETRSWGDVVFVNAAAFATFWAALSFVSAATRGLELGWEGHAARLIAVNIGGLMLARHLRARLATFVLASTAIAQLAEFAIHLAYGNTSAQGAATHFAVLLAAALGVGATALARRPDAVRDPIVAPEAENGVDRTSWSLVRSSSVAALAATAS